MFVNFLTSFAICLDPKDLCGSKVGECNCETPCQPGIAYSLHCLTPIVCVSFDSLKATSFTFAHLNIWKLCCMLYLFCFSEDAKRLVNIVTFIGYKHISSLVTSIYCKLLYIYCTCSVTGL